MNGFQFGSPVSGIGITTLSLTSIGRYSTLPPHGVQARSWLGGRWCIIGRYIQVRYESI